MAMRRDIAGPASASATSPGHWCSRRPLPAGRFPGWPPVPWKLLTALIVVVLPVLAGCGSSRNVVGSPEAAVDGFMRAMAHHDLKAALPNVDPAGRAAFLSAAGFSGSGGTITGLAIGQVIQHGSKAEVTVEGTFCSPTPQVSAHPACASNRNPDSRAPAFTVPCVKVKGRWYVDVR